MKKCSCPACHSINGWFFCFASCNGSKFASQSCKSHEAAATRTCISHISLQPFEVTNAAILASPRFQIVYGVRSVHLGQGGVMMKAQMPRKRHQVSLCENCISIKLYDVAIIYESQKYCRACATRNICKRATWKKNLSIRTLQYKKQKGQSHVSSTLRACDFAHVCTIIIHHPSIMRYYQHPDPNIIQVLHRSLHSRRRVGTVCSMAVALAQALTAECEGPNKRKKSRKNMEKHGKTWETHRKLQALNFGFIMITRGMSHPESSRLLLPKSLLPSFCELLALLRKLHSS